MDSYYDLVLSALAKSQTKSLHMSAVKEGNRFRFSSYCQFYVMESDEMGKPTRRYGNGLAAYLMPSYMIPSDFDSVGRHAYAKPNGNGIDVMLRCRPIYFANTAEMESPKNTVAKALLKFADGATAAGHRYQ